MKLSLLPSKGPSLSPQAAQLRWPRAWVFNWCLMVLLSQCTIHTTVREIPLRENEILTQEGDSIYTVANAYNVNVRELIEKNGLDATSPLLEPNQKLVLPARKNAAISAPVAGPEALQNSGPEVFSGQDDGAGGWTDVGSANQGQSVMDSQSPQEGLTAQEKSDGVLPIASSAVKYGKDAGIKAGAEVLADTQALGKKNLGKATEGGSTGAGSAAASGPLCFGMPVSSAPAQGFSSDHTGLTFPTKPGTPVHATEAGTVIFAGAVDSGQDVTIIVQHKDTTSGKSYLSVYLPVSPKGIKKGEHVARNQVLGHTQDSDAGHLYFEIREGSKRSPLDPKKLIKAS
jgi:murein DD-endopeptidase MepM/ murein hydrolase activator NlpD